MTPTFYTDKIDMEAGSWLARCQSGDLSAEDWAAFQLWLKSDHAHAAAFEHATNLWDALGAMPRGAYFPEKKEPARVLSRRALIAGVAVTAVLGSSALFLRKAQARNYETAIGEQSHIRLDDGSQLILDTNTSLAVETSDNRCLVNLRHGRINCHVAPNSRQFDVRAGERLIVGNRSVFDVQNSRDYFSVVLIDGDAELTSPATTPVVLRPGERVTATDGNALRYDKPDLSSLTSWQTGRLVFRDETILDAIQEMNRYSTRRLEVDDPRVGSLRISGGYVVGDSLGFAMSLSQLLPIGVRQAGDKIELVRKSET